VRPEKITETPAASTVILLPLRLNDTETASPFTSAPPSPVVTFGAVGAGIVVVVVDEVDDVDGPTPTVVTVVLLSCESSVSPSVEPPPFDDTTVVLVDGTDVVEFEGDVVVVPPDVMTNTTSIDPCK
jgi:hypothetical protein